MDEQSTKGLTNFCSKPQIARVELKIKTVHILQPVQYFEETQGFRSRYLTPTIVN